MLCFVWVLKTCSPKETNRLCNNLCLTLSIKLQYSMLPHFTFSLSNYNLHINFFVFADVFPLRNNSLNQYFGLVFRAFLVHIGLVSDNTFFTDWQSWTSLSISVCGSLSRISAVLVCDSASELRVVGSNQEWWLWRSGWRRCWMWPAGPQYHITRGAVPLGCQLLLPEDPEKQPQQQPPLPVQVPGPLPSLCGWVANLFYVMVFGVYHGIRIRSHSVSWNAPSSYHGITISAPWYFLWGNKWLSSVDQFTCFSVPFLLPKTLLWQFVAILLLVNLWLICMNLINMFLYDLLMHNLML